MSSRKHVPQRSCVACRRVTEQRELVRLVRTADNRVEIDPAGRKPGRGAYLCRSAECWEGGLKAGRLEKALKTGISAENREELANFVKCL